MQNSNSYEKSRGIVALAVNTPTTDYVAMAKKTVALASRVLNLPYTIITETQVGSHIVPSSRFDPDLAQFVEWKNFGRHAVYELSPYDETLVIDADYLVLEDSLQQIFDQDFDYLLMRSARMLDGEPIPTCMGAHGLPYVWATVFAFRKTERAKMFFGLVDRIQKNYAYYHSLFNVESRNYRNDYAFAMADIILNGHTLCDQGIPGALLNVAQPIQSISRHKDFVVIKDQQRSYVIPTMNIHVMSKEFLQSPKFESFVNESA